MKKYYSALLFLLLTVNLTANSTNDWTEKFKQIDQLHEKWNNTKSSGCALGIIKDGKWVHKQNFGMADVKKGIPITSQTQFDIASESKHFTGMAVLLLEEQGKLSLDDDVRKYVSEFKDYGDVVTINHLLTHTSGVRDSYNLMEAYRKQGKKDRNHKTLLGLILQQPALSFKPGDEHLYSNGGYIILVEVVERASGMNFQEFTTKHIFEPLGMSNTYFNRNDSIPENLAVPYFLKKDAKPEKGMKSWKFFSDVAGPVGLITCLDDMLQWDANFYNNKLGKGRPELIERLLEISRPNNGQILRYGKGIVNADYHGHRTQMHGGGAWHQSQIMRFPDEKITIVRFSNDSRLHSIHLLDKIANILLETKAFERQYTTNTTAQLTPGAYQVNASGLVRWIDSIDGKWYYKSLPTAKGELLLDGPKSMVLFESDNFFTLKVLGENKEGIQQIQMLNCGVHYLMLNKLPEISNTDKLEAFSGVYECKALDLKVKMKVTKKGVKVLMKQIPLKHLVQASNDAFAVPGEKLSVEFYRNEKGEVVGFYGNMWRAAKFNFKRVK